MQNRPGIENGKNFPITAKTLLGLEEVLAEEIRLLGGTDIQTIFRGVQFKGTHEVLYACNYACRTALRFLKPQWEFGAANENELYEKCMRLPWDMFMGHSQQLLM